ncbi:MAG: hypothetical protein ACR2N2_01735 [Acidimicrobiia bacterium]
MRRRILVLMAVVLAFVAAGCGSSSGDEPVEGAVTQVSGELGAVESFIVMDGNGDSHQFEPAEGLLFYGAPLDHLRDHILTGQLVKVTYEEAAYGALVATLIEHADGDSTHETGDDSGDDHSDHGG